MRRSSYGIVVDKTAKAYVEYKCLPPVYRGSNRWKPVGAYVRKACESCVIETHATSRFSSHGMDFQGKGLVPPTALPSHPPALVHEMEDGNGVRRSYDRAAYRRTWEILALGVADA
ncbi:MAG: hypothetical protein BMS9Abin29_2005 [Gemmatimonadota bacterium]|nr:MAG: hypothetical protein BMS9Abin29_2005 [Gemmatimonadota bacterium]